MGCWGWEKTPIVSSDDPTHLGPTSVTTPPATPILGGYLGWSQLSDLWEKGCGPLLLLSGFPVGVSVPVTSSVSAPLLALFWVFGGGEVGDLGHVSAFWDIRLKSTIPF